MAEPAIRSFEELECWKACRQLRLFIAKGVVPTLPPDERHRLADQFLRAARSTTNNVAEGYGRYHYLDNAKFCSNARGSCWEVLDHLIDAHDEGFLTEDLLKQGRGLVADAVRKLNGYIKYLREASTGSALREAQADYRVSASSASGHQLPEEQLPADQ